ncbi:carbohydrate ABC transporter substrate-binding protein [Dactylosporangium aurantiacum]|uniref:Probable sugar-binding periplasmic protein n=1 Tax=Dactylosporangium aurantiacum TaxID=35754 RepID=A0A9Q9IE37_9ACTN|nr:ABC transporter substrate-binding protein [Dactylosporangium aurantiacum]MDG6101534.1 ABC transporter substrate-binding protein [Dactylosporangium aurantiacum]UWZ52625.1 carbohydrate ABC transporter substrate-binding protein [Dactylosporangium aurantiacum]
MWKGRLAIIALLAVSLLSGLSMLTVGGASDDQLEVYSWWTGPGEEEGLAAMAEAFEAANPGIRFVNAAVSGGAGSNAKAILASRLLANDPPDSYQRHAGLELLDDVRSGKVRDLTELYEQQGWRKVFPKGLLDNLTIDGKIYAVPVNIHRANLIWFNPRTLRELGLPGPPKTWSDFLAQAATIQAKGKVPIAVGPEWTQKHLLETVLLGELGADSYERLFSGDLRWTSPEVTAALDTFGKVLAVSDVKSAAGEWQPQLDRVVEGSAVYAVMGDWSSSYLEQAKKLQWRDGYDVATSPGTQGVYDFLSDSFTLPSGARSPDLSRKWLIECGSAAGQNLFNPLKGSIPARTDAEAGLYRGYLGWTLQQWRDPKTRIVGSLTHGVVANNAYNAEIDSALGLFVQHGDLGKFAGTVQQQFEETR